MKWWTDLFGGREGWRRPMPEWGRVDLVVPLVLFATNVAMLEFSRSVTDFTDTRPVWLQYFAIASLSAALVFRRRVPLVTALFCLVHFELITTWMGEVGYQFTYQLAVFLGIYSGVAWGRRRCATSYAMAVITITTIIWIGYDIVVGGVLERFTDSVADMHLTGLLPPTVAFVLMTATTNTLYIGGAMWLGQNAWQQARDRERLADQKLTIEAQASELRDQAVTDERLRIARELHDVVAHHVSVMGIQAAGARRLLERDPQTAADALTHVEESARQAVTQMRTLLGALRGATGEGDEPTGRLPQPSLAQLPELLATFSRDGFTVEQEQICGAGMRPETLPLAVQLSIYRTVQEALSNVRRHSTADRASVVLRLHEPPGAYAEVEVLDEGHPRENTSGSGLGLLGMRERIASHGGTAEIGPRSTGGFRVRARFPLLTS